MRLTDRKVAVDDRVSESALCTQILRLKYLCTHLGCGLTTCRWQLFDAFLKLIGPGIGGNAQIVDHVGNGLDDILDGSEAYLLTAAKQLTSAAAEAVQPKLV